MGERMLMNCLKSQPKPRGWEWGGGAKERAPNWFSVEWRCVVECAWLARLWPLPRVCVKGRSHGAEPVWRVSHSVVRLAVRGGVAGGVRPRLGMKLNVILNQLAVAHRFPSRLIVITNYSITVI